MEGGWVGGRERGSWRSTYQQLAPHNPDILAALCRQIADAFSARPLLAHTPRAHLPPLTALPRTRQRSHHSRVLVLCPQQRQRIRGNWRGQKGGAEAESASQLRAHDGGCLRSLLRPQAGGATREGEARGAPGGRGRAGAGTAAHASMLVRTARIGTGRRAQPPAHGTHACLRRSATASRGASKP